MGEWSCFSVTRQLSYSLPSKLFSIALGLSLAVAAQSEPLPVFPDANLDVCFQEQVVANSWISTEDVDSLNCPGSQIKSLDGLELLTSLTEINLSNNQIVDIAPLHSLTQLTSLDLSDNQLMDFFLPPSVSLTALNISGNPLQHIDLPSLLNVRGLTELDLSYIDGVTVQDINQIISNNPGITKLGVAGLPLFDLQDLALSSLSNLQWLDVGETGLRDLTGIEVLENLNILNISNNNITDIQPMMGLVDLTELNVSSNIGMDFNALLSVINNNTALVKLNVAGILNVDEDKLPAYAFVELILKDTSSPVVVDQDGDGSEDSEEILAGTDPLSNKERPYWWKTINGDRDDDQFGSSLAEVGDVNNDGVSDIAVGAYGDDSNGLDSGMVKVLSGVDGSILYRLNGEKSGDEFGYAVNAAGDVNNDGVPDLIVGAPGAFNSEYKGLVRVYSGLDGAVLHTFSGSNPGDRFGVSVSSAGDVNGDGYTDILIGADRYDHQVTASSKAVDGGMARVYSGVDGAIIYSFYGYSSENYFGHSVSAIGDINKDGRNDFAIGEPGKNYVNIFDNANNRGFVHIYSGLDGSEIYQLYGENHEELGTSVASAGDVNNDGYPDVLVSSKSNNGVVRIFSGASAGELYRFTSVQHWSERGGVIGKSGDVDGDGYSDVIVGTYWDDVGKGAVQIFSGLTGSLLYTFEGDSRGDYFGYSVSFIRDLDGDGRDDIIIGAPKDDNHGGKDSGSIRVILSSDLLSDTDLDYIPNSIDPDDDNDGIADVIEVLYAFLNPLDPSDASEDFDGDGFSNAEELAVGSLPDNLKSIPFGGVSKAASDFDGDYDSDILWYHKGSGWLSRWSMNNAEVDEKTLIDTQVDTQWELAATADFDGDGDSDLLWYHAEQGWSNIWYMQNGVVVDKQPLGWTADLNWKIVGAGDFDGDGDADLVWRNKAYGWTSVWILDGSTIVEKKSVGTVSDLDWSIVAVADFNGDNKADLLWHHSLQGWSNVWTMDGASMTAKTPFTWVADTQWKVVATGDFNADGNTDLVWQHQLHGWTSLWTLSGLSVVDKSLIGTVSDRAWGLASSGDYDGDGDDDLLWHHAEQGWSNLWLLQDGVKSSQKPLGWLSDTRWQPQG